MNYKTERKYKEIPTTEILNFTAKEINYKQDKERDKQQDYKDELEQREPFADIKRKIENQDRRIKDLADAVTKLLSHKHTEDGEISIPIKNLVKQGYY